MSSPSCVLLYITVWSLPWLYALECVHVMQRAVQHSRVQTQRHRGEKNKQLEGKLMNRVLDGSGYSNCSCFFPKSHILILTIRFLVMIFACSIYCTKNPYSNCRSLTVGVFAWRRGTRTKRQLRGFVTGRGGRRLPSLKKSDCWFVVLYFRPIHVPFFLYVQVVMGCHGTKVESTQASSCFLALAC